MTLDPHDLAVIIMAGGAGTRFWPLSTEERPKQFLELFGERTLLQLCHDRVAGIVPPERILVLTAERFIPLVRQQLPELPPANIIGEPLRRDTAAAIALAALLCQHRWGNAVMAVLASDHLITPTDLFQRTLLSAARGAASSDALYTFGIQPTYASTAYGYLQRGERLLDDEGIEHFRLRGFREKPDAATAERFLDAGEFYWNSGMFVWTVAAILAELRANLPDHLTRLTPAVAQAGSATWPEALRAAFTELQPISIDFGVMERAREVRCVAARFDWSDVGGWLALEELLARDAQGNAHRGETRVHDAERNLVFCESPDEIVALVGVRDLIVVRTGNRTLVTHRQHAEAIKKLVQSLAPEER